MPIVLAFLNFFLLSLLPEKNFVKISTILVLIEKIKILSISGNIDKTKKADQILEMPGLGYCFKNLACEVG